jgi:hypothetical protein
VQRGRQSSFRLLMSSMCTSHVRRIRMLGTTVNLIPTGVRGALGDAAQSASLKHSNDPFMMSGGFSTTAFHLVSVGFKACSYLFLVLSIRALLVRAINVPTPTDPATMLTVSIPGLLPSRHLGCHEGRPLPRPLTALYTAFLANYSHAYSPRRQSHRF